MNHCLETPIPNKRNTVHVWAEISGAYLSLVFDLNIQCKCSQNEMCGNFVQPVKLNPSINNRSIVWLTVPETTTQIKNNQLCAQQQAECKAKRALCIVNVWYIETQMWRYLIVIKLSKLNTYVEVFILLNLLHVFFTVMMCVEWT